MSSESGHSDQRQDRRGFLKKLTVISMLPWLHGCGQAERPLRVAAHPWPGYELLFLARQEGWLDAGQVQLLGTVSATESMRALAEGRVEVACLTLDEVLRASGQGMPLQVVLLLDKSAGADALYARPEIRDIHGLAGKRVAVEDSAVGAILLNRVLELAGLDEADILVVPLAAHGQKQAWAAGEIDAAITYEPFATQLAAYGAKRIFDTRSAPDLIIDVLAVNKDLVTAQRQEPALRSLLRAHFRALDHFNANPQDASYRMAGRLNLTGAEALDAFRGLVLPDSADNRRLLQPDSSVLRTARDLNRILIDKGELAEMEDISSLFSVAYLP